MLLKNVFFNIYVLPTPSVAAGRVRVEIFDPDSRVGSGFSTLTLGP
jgi:hypothetical protein